jgi:hypothetical protein
MLKEKCEKYVSVKDCVTVFTDALKFLLNISQGDSTFDATLMSILNGGKYNSSILHLGS